MLTVAEAQARMGDTTTDTGVVYALIEGAHAFVEKQTGRSFRAAASGTLYLDGGGSRRLYLPEPPILTGTPPAYDVAVEERSYPGADATTLVLDTDFALRPNNGAPYLVRLENLVWRQGYEYAVAYTTGYEDDEYPADIVDLVAGLVSLRVQLGGMEAVRSESVGGYSYTRFGEGDLDAIPGARDTIAAWRRPVYA